MRNFDIKITENDFNTMANMEHKAQAKYLEDNVLTMAIVCGYGFYGHTAPRFENGEYLVNICTGNTCD